MRLRDDRLELSASDLGGHLACGHLTQLDRAVAEGRLGPPAWRDPAREMLEARGLAHEAAYVRHLRDSGLTVVELRDVEGATAAKRALAAMRGGADAIVQAPLAEGRWSGRADVLLRVPLPSALGEWSYEVVDTKLAQETKGTTLLQLSLYSDLLGRLQGQPPVSMHVVKPVEGFVRESFRCADFEAYYRLVRRRLEETVTAPPSERTYPEPVAHCEICRWWKECDDRRHRDDHLSLVAGIRPLHTGELRRQGVATLERLATEKEPLPERPKRGNLETFAKAQEQARVQLAGRNAGRPVWELLPAEPMAGLARLPEPSAGDVFFDIESDPFVSLGGIEYLLGVAFAGEDGTLEYRAAWALDRASEKVAFERFIDFVMERWKAYPGMCLYHFSPYEPAAVKRLMTRHGTREAEVDRLLRGGRFVDLLAVTRRGLRASVESYSLKELEPFFGFSRKLDLDDAGAALRRVSWALELGVAGEILEEDLRAVEAYNRDDCLSTHALRAWLEEQREALAAKGETVERPVLGEGEASEELEARSADVQAVFDRLVEGVPDDPAARTEEQRARWLLAHQLDYFRREEKSVWWEFYRLQELDHEDLLEERKAVSGLELVGELPVLGRARTPVHRYRFPPQEAALDEGDALHEVGAGGDRIGTVSAIDHSRRTLDIKKSGKAAGRHPVAVAVNDYVTARVVETGLLELGRFVAANGLDGEGPFRAVRDLLQKRPPRRSTPESGPLRRSGETTLDAALRLARDLDHGVLPIQGPPGSGKTYTGARMIVDLAMAGKRVGITAVSHKVIRKLLQDVLEAARERRVAVRVAQKVGEKSGDAPDGLLEIDDNDEARAFLLGGHVLGGTAWLFARPDMIDSLDYLFFDEAGQMSLAFALGAGRAGRNLVLLGDPQQLEQPQKGAHPEGAEVAALVHLLDGERTIAPEKGLFLDETHRLHPDLCSFTSESYYEARLQSRPGLERQALSGTTRFAGSGLFFVPVEHEGNQSTSVDEAEAVAGIVTELLASGYWTNKEGASSKLTEGDILVVTPYNSQVAAIKERVPRGVAVGTVDKFQGQEAPVVLYSMASSSAEDAPRGMSFLYNPNRFNVATSRARCACILVASPRVLEPDCRTPEQMRWANGVCRFAERTSTVPARKP